jgi:hypothetical protein
VLVVREARDSTPRDFPVRDSRAVRRALLLTAIAAALALPAGWCGTDRLEQDDAFCNACHLPGGATLHEAQLADFRARPAVSLAVAHAAAGNDARGDGAFRCIDCHGGTGLAGRARVKLLSARDALVYVTGRFAEPEGMRWPLRDEDCRRCHATFAARVREWDAPAFHELPVHNRELGVDCVECHLAHPRGGLAERGFVHPEPVRAQCARCHSEFEEPTS